jgi:Cu2+-exporting ATPase
MKHLHKKHNTRNKHGKQQKSCCHKKHEEHITKHEGHTMHEHMDMEHHHKGNHHAHHAHMVQDFKKRFLVSLFLTIPILLLSPMIQSFIGLEKTLTFSGDMYVLFLLSSAIFFYGGKPFLKGLFDELKAKNPGMMTLIGVAITIAYGYSSAVVFGLQGKMFFWELSTLIDVMLLGHWIEMRSIMGAGQALEELAKLMPSNAHKILSNGKTKDIPLNELKVGDKVLVKPGEKIPADGKIVKGQTSVNESMLTGESKPIDKKISATVIGGSINGEGSIIIIVKKTGKDSFLSQVIELVKEAQESKSKTENLANKAAFWLTIIAIIAGSITLFIWLVFTSQDFAFALERMVSVMVITCPHALGLAIPLVVAVSTSIAAANGLLIRNRTAFENARKIDAIIFDKTGTLTEGKFGITDTLIFDSKIKEADLLSYAASVEFNSEHPIAKGIVTSTKKKWDVTNFKAIPGKGAEGKVKGKNIKVVSSGYLKENKITINATNEKKISKLTAQGKTVVFVLINKKLTGAIALADIIRKESKSAISKLKEMGIHCMMITGDNKQVANWVAKEIGLDEVIAEVLPKEKSSKIKEVQKRGLVVAMTGDGVNDAPALATANIGIAIGAGTDVAVETADIILVKSNPLDVVSIITLARKTYTKMVQNLVWATAYNAVALPLAAGILYTKGIVLNPASAGILMALSTIIVAFNAKLLSVKVK